MSHDRRLMSIYFYHLHSTTHLIRISSVSIVNQRDYRNQKKIRNDVSWHKYEAGSTSKPYLGRADPCDSTSLHFRPLIGNNCLHITSSVHIWHPPRRLSTSHRLTKSKKKSPTRWEAWCFNAK